MGAADLARRGWDRVRYLLAPRQARRHALSGPLGAWKQKRDYQIAFLREVGLRPEHHLLEIGCGTLRGGLPIIEFLHEGHYQGVDVREIALREARKELAEADLEHKRPSLHLTDDLSRARFGRRFDFIWAFSVLMHLEDEVLGGALRCAAAHLAADGRFLANVELGPARLDGTWAEFPNLVRPLEAYDREAAAHGLAVEDMGPLSSLGHPPDAVNAHHHMLRFTVAGS